jgi:hypothetical protein
MRLKTRLKTKNDPRFPVQIAQFPAAAEKL